MANLAEEMMMNKVRTVAEVGGAKVVENVARGILARAPKNHTRRELIMQSSKIDHSPTIPPSSVHTDRGRFGYLSLCLTLGLTTRSF